MPGSENDGQSGGETTETTGRGINNHWLSNDGEFHLVVSVVWLYMIYTSVSWSLVVLSSAVKVPVISFS